MPALAYNKITGLREALPFVKWAGGKGRLLPKIKPFLPDASTITRYHEPFAGGAALFFHLHRLNPDLTAFLSDSNEELINCYRHVIDHPKELIKRLEQMPNESAFYYEIRQTHPDSLDSFDRAVRFIYLNKTCYNGLYRVNKQGLFNVPFGNNPRAVVCDRDGILSASKALRRATVYDGTFDRSLAEGRVQAGDFIYLDPPYQPLSKTSRFTAYTDRDFHMRDHARLADLARRLDALGARFLLSNSDTPELRELYADFCIDEIIAPRYISCRGDRREGVTELLIKNY